MVWPKPTTPASTDNRTAPAAEAPKEAVPSARLTNPARADDYPATSTSIPPIEAHDGSDEEDEFDPIDYDASSLGVSVSITASIYEHEFQNGRRYHHYRYGRYPLPNDDDEQYREQLKHVAFLEAMGGALFLSPIGTNPQKIIDLGTGSGNWAIAVADENPSAEVIGTDLSPIQPSWVPPNCKFYVDDVEDTWVHGSGFDLVHARSLAQFVKDVDFVIAQAEKHLRPGGWIEFQEFGANPRCDDDTMAQDHMMQQFMDLCAEACEKFGTNFRVGDEIGTLLKKAGFVNVQCKIYKLPICRWPKDKTLRLIGLYMEQNSESMLDAMCARPFKTLGKSEEELQAFAARCRKEWKDTTKHVYIPFLVWIGQKPE